MLRVLLGLFITVCAMTATAEQSKKVGELVLHYNAFNSASLTPEIAKQYQITRGGNQGVLTLSLKTDGPKNERWILANVSGSISNLIGQSNTLNFKEVREGSAVYYIATFRFDDKDHMKFDVVVAPETAAPFPLQFTQQFFAD